MPLTGPEKQTIVAYNNIAEARRRSLTTNINFWLPEFMALIKEGPANPVFLDLGSGDGRDAALYKSVMGNLNNYIGLDLSSGMISSISGRNLGNCPLVLADMYNLPVESGKVDLVWSTASLIHTPREKIGEQLSEIYRSLKTGGKAFFSIKYGEGEGWEQGRNPLDFRYIVYWKETNFKEVLMNSGLTPGKFWVDTVKDDRGIPWLCAYATK